MPVTACRGGCCGNLRMQRQEQVDPGLELDLYRMVQELLNNSLKHARATTIHIKLLFADNEATLHFNDDGVGSMLPPPDRRREWVW